MSPKLFSLLASCLFLMASCLGSPTLNASTILAPTLTPLIIATITPTTTPLPSSTASPTSLPSITPTFSPMTLVFYGDSVLKVGDTTKQGQVGFSIVDSLRNSLDPSDQIILSNHGGQNAQWGYYNLETNVLNYNPDLVTLWWGLNDLGGCPGIFDPVSNTIVSTKLKSMINNHMTFLNAQIKALLDRSIPVVVITPIPVLGSLPWSHMDANNQLVWEEDHRCEFNSGLEQLVDAQRKLVASFEEGQNPVYLVDAWQIYKDHPNTDDMYMDIVHPGDYGAELIASVWMKVFYSIRN